MSRRSAAALAAHANPDPGHRGHDRDRLVQACYRDCGMTRAIRIIGIDPGLRRTGWGVVETEGNRLSFVGCGSVTTDDRNDLAARLLTIHDGLMRILEEF